MNTNNKYSTDINTTRAVQNNQNAGFNQNPYINQQESLNQNLINNPNNQNPQQNTIFSNGDFVKGALIGAALTYLLTNKNAQETIMKTASKGTELFQAGMEELKERYEDAKAQMEANKN